jgi:hypothetical protein
MEMSDETIMFYMAQNPGWHIPSKILEGSELKGRSPEKKMSLNNVIKRCRFLVSEKFLKTPDPEKDKDWYRMKKDGIFCINSGIETLKNLINLDEHLFHKTFYVQNMINKELVGLIKTSWFYYMDLENSSKGSPLTISKNRSMFPGLVWEMDHSKIPIPSSKEGTETYISDLEL